jgi:hypothetical protein
MFNEPVTSRAWCAARPWRQRAYHVPRLAVAATAKLYHAFEIARHVNLSGTAAADLRLGSWLSGAPNDAHRHILNLLLPERACKFSFATRKIDIDFKL